MNTLSLSKKIGLTISLVLLFFVVLAVVMFIAMSKISSSFDGFSQSVTEGNDASDTTVAALEMRSNIAEYISSRKESNVSKHRAMYSELGSNLAAAVRETEDPKSRKALEGAQSLLKGYDEAFNAIVELRAQEAKLIAETIRPGSAEIKRLLKEMLSADQSKGDIAAAFASSTALQAMFEAESSVNRIILSFNEDDIKAAQGHAALLGTKLAALQSDYQMNVEFDESLADANKEKGLAQCLELNKSFSEGIVALASTLRRIKEIDERDLMPVGPRFASQMGEVRQAASSHQAELKADVEQLQSTVNTLIVAIGLIGLACGAGVSIFIVRGITRSIDVIVSQLESNASETYQASSQVSSNSESLARDSSDQAAAIEETSSSLEEVNAMTEKNAENAESAKSLAREARIAAESGSESMKDMIVAMQEIKDSSDNIANIIKTIDEIAFQTNILALNAAVEAARAGESGAGFAVVADEVRSLAHRSAEAASVTAEKIANSVQKSVRGVELNQRVAQNLQTIVQRTQQMDELVAQISDASSEQNRGVSLIQRSITQMDSVTQRNAAGAEETASSARVLLQQSNSLQDTIADLVRVVNGGGSRRPATTSSSRRPSEFDSSSFDDRAEVEFEAPRRGKKPGKVASSSDGHSVDLWEN